MLPVSLRSGAYDCRYCGEKGWANEKLRCKSKSSSVQPTESDMLRVTIYTHTRTPIHVFARVICYVDVSLCLLPLCRYMFLNEWVYDNNCCVHDVFFIVTQSYVKKAKTYAPLRLGRIPVLPLFTPQYSLGYAHMS